MNESTNTTLVDPDTKNPPIAALISVLVILSVFALRQCYTGLRHEIYP